MRNLIKTCNQSNDDLPLVTALERSLSKGVDSRGTKLNQKSLLIPRITLTTPLDFQQPIFKTPALVNANESKSSGFNPQPPKTVPKDLTKDTQVPLIDPGVIAQAKANKQRELEHQNKPEGELTRQLTESPSYIGLCKFLKAQIVGAPIEELKTPMMKTIIDGSEMTYRQAETPLRAESQESAFAVFNPAEEVRLARALSNFGLPFGRSPTTQFGRYSAQPEDESLLDERVTPLSATMARYNFSNTQSNEQETRYNY